ncbi:hypothetical protein BSKO_12594 [Bryopsis sp. KO-2023]|nr:hypothetical protein BSKO_12594 [Bryopsis sp. KO-2023]
MASIKRAVAEAAADANTNPYQRRPIPRPFKQTHPVHQAEPPQAPPAEQVDREKVCPLLLRVFPKLGGHHGLEDFARRGREPPGEVQIYTWKDATLRELTDLIKEVQPEARKPTTRLSFALVYPDKKGRNVLRQVGETHSSRPGEDDKKSLEGLNFETGDFMDVAIRV